MLKIDPSPKEYTVDQDKAVSPADTVNRVKEALSRLDIEILSEVRRVDNGRLDIPVFLSVAGANARMFMPTRKQMGKGATRDQAEASAIMELMERYGFFTFWHRSPDVFEGTWDEAEARFGADLIDINEIIKSVQDKGSIEQTKAAMNLIRWQFFPVLHVSTGKMRYVPLDWFKKLGEFNGSSAGNTDAESILQGACELVERHVCCIIEEAKKPVPSIDTDKIDDPVLKGLLQRFSSNGITVLLKDFSLDMPAPTIAALAFDPASFPEKSEIVYTAGTASSPVKAAIRALTEVAQLGGDFNSGSCYEASGLPKYTNIQDTAWLYEGEKVNLNSLPSIETTDFLDELMALSNGLKLKGYNLYSISTTNPATQVPTHYSFVPGFRFRERDSNASVGLFAGRILVEENSDEESAAGLAKLEQIYPGSHYLPFFKGLLAMNSGNAETSARLFEEAEKLQPDADSKGLAAFYHAYVLTSMEEWEKALPILERAISYCPDMKEYYNLAGVCNYKLKEYANAAGYFEHIVRHLDKGSVMDIANLGVCHKFLGNQNEAAHYLGTALEIEPGLEFARQHLEDMLKQ